MLVVLNECFSTAFLLEVFYEATFDVLRFFLADAEAITELLFVPVVVFLSILVPLASAPTLLDEPWLEIIIEFLVLLVVL